MFRCVSRAHYSTNVTEEFINSILARAQEATAKASSNAIKMDQKKGHRASNMNRSRNQNRNNRNNNEGKDIEGRHGERNMRLNNRAPNGDSTQNTNRQKWNRSTTTSFIKDPSDTTVVVQPQFKKMQNHRNNFNENSKVEDDLLDVFNSSMDQKQRPNNFNKNTKPQARFLSLIHI